MYTLHFAGKLPAACDAAGMCNQPALQSGQYADAGSFAVTVMWL